MNEQFRSSFVRIWGSDGAVVGAGVLVGRRHVLTCAHVVAYALGESEDSVEAPAGAVMIDFPLAGQRAPAQPATVVHWTPVRADGDGDVAGLALDQDPPPGAEPARLISADEPWGHTFRTFGFPSGATGDWASGVLRDTQTLRWLQVESGSGRRVQKGYSGAPVWVDELHGVVGIVVAADQAAADRVAYVIPTAVLVETWPDLLRERVVAPCPYRGLSTFREGDSELFFGREEVVARLLAAVDRKPLVAVVGPSGSGKSSVVQAGLTAELRRRGRCVIVTFRPRKDAFEELAAALLPELEPGLGPVDLLLKTRPLAGLLREGRLETVLQQLRSGDRSDWKVVLVADQFEELYTQSDVPETAPAFVAELLRLSAAAGRERGLAVGIVLTLRADFLGLALGHHDFTAALRDAIEPIGPMSRQELRAAIEKPAALRGARFQTGLVDRILDEVEREPGGLPLLEFALTLLWDRQEQGLLTHQAYEALGGVRAALSQHADQVYMGFPESERQRVRRVFVQLVSPGEGTEDSRRLASRGDVKQDDWEIVQRLADERLVVTSQGPSGEAVAEVAHEALIAGWGQLRSWMAADRDFRLWQERVRTAIRLWRDRNQDEAVLLRGSLLVEAETWLSRRSDDITTDEEAFVHRSRRRQEEEDARYRRLYQEALSRQLVAQAELSRSHQPNLLPLSVLLLVESLRRVPSFESDYALRIALALLPTSGLRLAHEGEVRAIALSPDGLLVLSGSDDATARIWDAATGTPLATLRHGERGWVRAVAFSADGRMAASAGADQAARVWRVRDGSQLHCLDHQEGVRAVAFHPGGTWLATGCDDGTARVWDTTSGDQVMRQKYQGWVRIIAFGAGGDWLLAGGGDGTVRLLRSGDWTEIARLEHGRPVRTAAVAPGRPQVVTSAEDDVVRVWTPGSGEPLLLPHPGPVNAVAFSPDASRVATACDDGRVRLWDARAGTELIRLPHQGPARCVAFTPDGSRLVTGGDDGTARVWDATGTELVRASHDGSVRAVAIGPGGGSIATASLDGTAAVWSVAAMAELHRFRQAGRVTALTFSPDGAWLAAAGEDGSACSLRVGSGQQAVRFDHDDAVRALAFSPDGSRLVTAGDDGRARAWDRETGDERWTSDQGDALVAVAFSPDGTRLAAAGDGGATRLWDLAANGGKPRQLSLQSSARAVAFRPDGTEVLVATEDGVHAWAPQTGAERMLPGAGDGWLGAVALHSGTGQAAVVGADNAVRVLDVDTGAVRALLAHDRWVRALVFDPEGRRLATACEDAAVRVWDVQTGVELRRFPHDSWVGALAFSPDGRLLGTGSDDGTIGVWTLDPADLIAQACTRVTRNLSQDEWRRYLGTEPYRETCGSGPAVADAGTGG